MASNENDDQAKRRARLILRTVLQALFFILGGIAAFYATYFACVRHSEAAAQVGWIFLFFTMPAGGIVGLVIGTIMAAKIHPRVGSICSHCRGIVENSADRCTECGYAQKKN